MPAVVKYGITEIYNWSSWLYLGWACKAFEKGEKFCRRFISFLLCTSLSESFKTLLVTFFRRDI